MITPTISEVLDFGLAKGRVRPTNLPREIAALVDSPTLSSPRSAFADAHLSATLPGVILGTAAYLSPEQRVEGRGCRTDICLSAACLRMPHGRRAFEGTVSDTIAKSSSGRWTGPTLPKSSARACVSCWSARCKRSQAPPHIGTRAHSGGDQVGRHARRRRRGRSHPAATRRRTVLTAAASAIAGAALALVATTPSDRARRAAPRRPTHLSVAIPSDVDSATSYRRSAARACPSGRRPSKDAPPSRGYTCGGLDKDTLEPMRGRSACWRSLSPTRGFSPVRPRKVISAR